LRRRENKFGWENCRLGFHKNKQKPFLLKDGTKKKEKIFGQLYMTSSLKVAPMFVERKVNYSRMKTKHDVTQGAG
jgi:hypothetical protein